MNKILLPLALGAIAATSACNQEDHTITGGPADPMANVSANSAPVELPPSILASKTYRCKDNSIVTIDWMSDKKSANLRAGEGAAIVQLTAATEGEKMAAADGTTLTGNAEAGSVQLALPGKGAQDCKH